MTPARSHSSSLTVLLILVGLFAGCGTTSRPDLWRQHFGIRPDEPQILVRTGTNTTEPCDEYKTYSDYAQQLEEAYHSRATQNRGWIYVAGILGLGVAAASGGLAAATAAGAGTLGLLSISGGFSAAAFATLDNSDLAQIYTISANRIDTALKEADSVLPFGGRYCDQTACGHALRILKDGVSEARTTLEVSRTNSAVGALVRAKEQQKILDALIAGQQAADPTRVTLPADITDLKTDPDPPIEDKPTQVTLTIRNIRLDQVAPADVTVLFGMKELPLDGPTQLGSDNTYSVKFTAPANRPDPTTKDYAPALLVGKTKRRVVSQQGKKFTYP